MKYLLLVFLLVGCGASVAEAPTEAEIECGRYEACKAEPGATTVCIAGNCACAPETKPGLNRAYSCATGEPDGMTADPRAKKP
jgi:hypothetical protein